MPVISWWHWIIGGFLLMACQFVIPSFTIVWFGLGALFTGIIKIIWPSYPVTAQILTWAISSFSFDAMWFKYVKTKADTIRGDINGLTFSSGVGVIIKGAPPRHTALVKFEVPLGGADEWPCTADSPLTFGDRVKVVDFSDKVIKVMKMQPGRNG